MSWEQALEYCRAKYSELTSLLSETELLLALSEMTPAHVTERVWIGLRYLGGQWLWVNREPLKYKAWSQKEDVELQCPVKSRCGALNKKGEWENWDCQEKLNFICY